MTPGRKLEIWVLDVTLGMRRSPGWPEVMAPPPPPPTPPVLKACDAGIKAAVAAAASETAGGDTGGAGMLGTLKSASVAELRAELACRRSRI